MIKRIIEDKLKATLGKGKIVIIYGPRQVGKTTLVKKIVAETPNSAYFSCEEPDVRIRFSDQPSSTMMGYIGGAKLVIFDEAQLVPNIGRSLKLLHDAYPKLQIIATGSSSFDLAQRVVEPMTGRHVDFELFPFLWSELANIDGSRMTEIRELENRILYGAYPDVLFPPESESKREILSRLVNDYALRDVLGFSGIRKSNKIFSLLQALAYQIGQEVSFPEIGRLVGLNQLTVENYIDILEKAYLIFRLSPKATNPRTGLRRTRKVFFWDTGLRNALIHHFEPLPLRPDKGLLFENFFISERLKKIRTEKTGESISFWRAYSGEEIDLLVEKDGDILGYECKWEDEKEQHTKSPHAPVRSVQVITSKNYFTFLE